MSPSVYFQGGTLVLKDVPAEVDIPLPFQWIKARWRCEAYHYGSLFDWFRASGIRDTVPLRDWALVLNQFVIRFEDRIAILLRYDCLYTKLDTPDSNRPL